MDIGYIVMIVSDYYDRNKVLDDIFALEKPFKMFGSFIEELILVGSDEFYDDEQFRIDVLPSVLRSFEKVIELCPNLRKLCFKNIEFKPADIHILLYVS